MANESIRQKVEQKVAARKELVFEAFGKLEQLQVQIRKARPDQRSLDADGKVVSEAYSPGKYQELAKLKEQHARLEAAVDRCLSEAATAETFEALKKQVEKAKGGKSEPETEGGDS